MSARRTHADDQEVVLNLKKIVATAGLLVAAALGLWACGEEEGCGECIRAVECVEACGGNVVQSGCCPCPEGTFDNIQCSAGGEE
jgi:hypothetical protein